MPKLEYDAMDRVFDQKPAGRTKSKPKPIRLVDKVSDPNFLAEAHQEAELTAIRELIAENVEGYVHEADFYRYGGNNETHAQRIIDALEENGYEIRRKT